MDRFSFKRNPVLWIAAGLGAVLYVMNGMRTDDWSLDTLNGFLTAAFSVIAAFAARANVYSPATVDEFASATDYEPVD
jgi:hypothetical protein